MKKNNPPLCRWGKPRWQGAQNPGFRWNYVRVQNSSFEDSMARSPRQGPHGKVMRSRLNWNLRPKKQKLWRPDGKVTQNFPHKGFERKYGKYVQIPEKSVQIPWNHKGITGDIWHRYFHYTLSKKKKLRGKKSVPRKYCHTLSKDWRNKNRHTTP